MINFKHYVITHLKGFGLIAIGFFCMLLGIIGFVLTFKVGVFIFMAILAIFFVGWGVYKINHLSYQRENEGNRVYIYKGGFR